MAHPMDDSYRRACSMGIYGGRLCPTVLTPYYQGCVLRMPAVAAETALNPQLTQFPEKTSHFHETNNTILGVSLYHQPSEPMSAPYLKTYRIPDLPAQDFTQNYSRSDNVLLLLLLFWGGGLVGVLVWVVGGGIVGGFLPRRLNDGHMITGCFGFTKKLVTWIQ